MPSSFNLPFSIAAFSLLVALSGSANSQSASEFYRGTTITFNVATPAAGGYANYARVLIKHMQNKIPGNPKIIPQFMPGAGGAKAANYVYNVAARDGSVIGMPINSMALLQLLNPEGVRYEPAKFSWIGTVAGSTSVIAVWSTAPIKSLEDAKRTEVIIGATAKGSHNYMVPALANALLGTKFRIITGYTGGGGGSMDLAMERGEVHGRNTTWQSWETTRADWIREGKVRPLLQDGPAHLEVQALKGTPRFMDVVRSNDEKKMVGLLQLPAVLGRSVYAPPAIPADRLMALRRALSETLVDRQFLEDAKSTRLSINPGSGEALVSLIKEASKTPAEIVERFKEAVGYN